MTFGFSLPEHFYGKDGHRLMTEAAVTISTGKCHNTQFKLQDFSDEEERCFGFII